MKNSESRLKTFLQKFKKNIFSSSQKSPISKCTSQTLLKSKNSDSPQFQKKIMLPQNFAENLLNLELEIEENFPPSLKLIKKLIDFYCLAVEYYESIHNKRYIIFKDKLNSFLNKPSIIAVLSGEKEDNEKNIKENKIKTLEFQCFLENQSQNSSQKAIYLLNKEKNLINDMNIIIEKEIDYQKKNILDRIENRKRAISLYESHKNNNISMVITTNDLIEIEEEKKIEKKSENELYKKNSMIMLKKDSMEIDSIMQKLGRKSSSINNKNSNLKENQKIVDNYNEQINKLKKNIKDNKNSLLINKIVQKYEFERDQLIAKIEN